MKCFHVHIVEETVDYFPHAVFDFRWIDGNVQKENTPVFIPDFRERRNSVIKLRNL